MDDLKYRDSFGFDMDKAKRCAKTYSTSVEIETIIIDTSGNILFDTSVNKSVCILCKKIQGVKNQQQSCSNAHLLYGSYQAERFGGKYVFFCPLGLTHWASPITVDGMMRGAILGGPVLMIEPEDFLIDDFILKNDICEPDLIEIKRHIKETTVVRPEKVNELSELLFIVASSITETQKSHYFEDREIQEQQAIISEYIQYIKTMGGSTSDSDSYPFEKEKELISLISIGDKAGSQKVLNEILGHIFFSTGRNFEVIKARVLELVVLLSRAALEGGADIEQIFGLNYNYLSQTSNFKTVEELTYWLSKIMARFTDCVFNLTNVKHVDIIYKAINYIKKYYMNKLTLEGVSSHVYLSPSYFSKIFKEEMKSNFNTYLNNIRIEVAKKLLADDTVALVDVSSLVGYEDQSYFSKVFKKMTGVSPGKFRENRGNLKSNRNAKT